MGTHPYMLIGDSTYKAGGKVIGSSSSSKNALTNKSIIEVQIPSYFDNKPVIEIGIRALGDSKIIKKIFVPKTVLSINQEAFNSCSELIEVRFEEGSKLEYIGLYAFAHCYKLMKIDIPSSVTTIIAPNTGCQFFSNTIKDCISYLGTTDYSSSSLFDSNNVPSVIYVSVLYPSDFFGGQRVTKNDKTCGVSNNPLVITPRRSRIKKCSFVIRHNSPNYFQYMFLLISL